MDTHEYLDTGLPQTMTPDYKMNGVNRPVLWSPSSQYAFKHAMPYFLELSVVLEERDIIYYEITHCGWGDGEVKGLLFCTKDRLDITPHVAMLLQFKCATYGAATVIPFKVNANTALVPRGLINGLAYHLFGQPTLFAASVDNLPTTT